MAINLEQDIMQDFNNKKKDYMNLMRSEDSTPEQLEESFSNMFDALQNDLAQKITSEAKDEVHDAQILAARGQNVLTSKERKFFNDVALSGGFDEDSILPETTQERVFDDLVQEHPLLQEIGLQDLGAVTRFIFSDPDKAYAWGKLFGDIKGQVSTAFTDETITQLKLTAFAVVPKDMLELGPEWIERYTRELLVEAYAVGLEYGLINGAGPSKDEPIGLIKDVDEDGGISDKASSGTLTFAPSDKGTVVAGELYEVIQNLSQDEDGDFRRVDGKIVMVVNPVDSIAVRFRNTIQNANGQWVTALPYDIKVVESVEVEQGKAIFFVRGQYIAAIAGGYKINRYKETLSIEDADLYTMKQFANGRPKDNKAAVVYDLDINFDGGDEGEETP